MKKLLIASTLLTLSASVGAEEIKVGVILGFTGPIESLTPGMAAGARLPVCVVIRPVSMPPRLRLSLKD
jgi:branched-chain amino acid transport system substrate-binding protein